MSQRIITRPPLGIKEIRENVATVSGLQQRKPIAQVSAKRKASKKTSRGKAGLLYMKDIHEVECVVCKRFGMQQASPTTAHHPFHGRFGTLRSDDLMCIALCECHHQGLRHDRDRAKIAIHQEKARWAATYDPDYTYIPATRALVEALRGEIDF